MKYIFAFPQYQVKKIPSLSKMYDFKTTKIMKKGDDGEGYNDGN